MPDRFALPARLDSSGARLLARALLARRGRPLVICAAGVEQIGALACEVLIAAGRQWAADGQPLAIKAPSDRFRTACATLGLCADAPWAAPGPPLAAVGARA